MAAGGFLNGFGWPRKIRLNFKMVVRRQIKTPVLQT